jgi:mediator of RNA polymerase II transcription subunit 16
MYYYEGLNTTLGTDITTSEFSANWVAEMVRILRIEVDYSVEPHDDAMFRNSPLQMCLSTFNHLGWNGEYKARNFCSKLSMFALNLRNIAILISIANSAPGSVKDTTPLDEPGKSARSSGVSLLLCDGAAANFCSEVVDALAGCYKWFIDLLSWLADSLFCLLDDSKFQGLLNQQNFSEMTPYLVSKNEVALHMILSSTTRNLLCAVCRRVTHLYDVSQRAIIYYESRGSGNDSGATPGQKGSSATAALHRAYQKIMRYTDNSLIDVNKFHDLLTKLSHSIRGQYTESFAGLAKTAAASNAPRQPQNPNAPKTNPGEEVVKRARTQCELTMLLGGSPPHSFQKVVQNFFKEDLASFRAQCDPAKLFFADYGLLEVDDDPKALATRRQRGVRVDLFKRVELFPTRGSGEKEAVPWRRCVRCASVMEEITISPATRPTIVFLLNQQRNCCCSGRLVLLDPGEIMT